MAQGPPPSCQPSPPVSCLPDPPAQNPPGAQGVAPASDSATPASPTPAETPLLVQPSAPLYLRPLKQTPLPAGYAPELKLSAGYSVTSLALPSSARLSLSGANLTASFDPGKRFGATLDLDYAVAPNVFKSGRHMDMLTYLLGPVLYPSRGNSLTTFVYLLGGGARVAGPFPDGNGGLNSGHVQYPAWAVGGGAEYRLSPAFGFRVSVDYLQTHFYNASAVVRPQNDFRIVNSIVFYPGMPTFRRSH
jgi:hypothetical protein